MSWRNPLFPRGASPRQAAVRWVLLLDVFYSDAREAKGAQSTLSVWQGACLQTLIHRVINYYLPPIIICFLSASLLWFSSESNSRCQAGDILGNADYIIFTSVPLVYASLSVNFVTAPLVQKQ